MSSTTIAVGALLPGSHTVSNYNALVLSKSKSVRHRRIGFQKKRKAEKHAALASLRSNQARPNKTVKILSSKDFRKVVFCGSKTIYSNQKSSHTVSRSASYTSLL